MGPQGDIGPLVPAPPVPTLLTAAFSGVPMETASAVTSVTIAFARPVTGVTLDDFVLKRGSTFLSLAGARLTTTDGRTYTLSQIPGTTIAATYLIRLKGQGTGIADAFGLAPMPPIIASWRMTRTVAA